MRKPVLTCALGTCLFLLILGAKWATFHRFGSAMPNWDQWDAEAVELLIPWFEKTDFLAHLFHPHNEHRIILTKLQNLALVLLNGQWDSRLEAVVNATLHSALAVAFWGWAQRGSAARDAPDVNRPTTLGGVSAAPLPVTVAVMPTPPMTSSTSAMAALPSQWQERMLAGALFGLAFALFGLPVAWQNVLGGFHSQQYWLLGLSFAAIVILPFARTWSAAWWVGAAAAVLALGSMGSGFLAAAIIFALQAWRVCRTEVTLRAAGPTLALTALLVAVGMASRVEVPYHADLKAKTAHDFIFSILHSLEWPLRDHVWAASILWLPWAIVTWRVLGSRRRFSPPSSGRDHGVRPPPFASSGDATDDATSAPPSSPPPVRPPVRPSGARGFVAAASVAPPVAAPTHATQALVALGAWVLVQVFATAYARGAGADFPASRYMDTLTFGAMVNGTALAWLISHRTLAAAARATGRPGPVKLTGFRALMVGLAVAWVVILAVGLRGLLDGNLRYQLPDEKKYFVKAEGHMRRYLATNDPSALAYPDIPYPSAGGLIERLAHPSLRALMPVPIRAPLALTPARREGAWQEYSPAAVLDPGRPAPTGFPSGTAPPDAVKTWGSFTAAGNASVGTWTSEPVATPPFGWLRFETAGNLPPTTDAVGGISLALHDAESGTVLRRILPQVEPGNAWAAAYVRAPRRPFVVTAQDPSEEAWLAFSAPVEMGALSYWAAEATWHGESIVYGAAVATVLLAGFGYCGGRTRRLR